MRTPAIIRNPRVDAFRRSLAAALGRVFGATGDKVAATARITPSRKPKKPVYRLEGAVEFGRIFMDGSVPSLAVRAGLRDEFALSRTSFEIVDRTQIREGAPDHWDDAAHAAVEAMTLLRSGHVSVKDTVVMVGGVALHHAGHERLKELHGGRKGRSFAFNAGAVSPPIPAAPMGPPPPEAEWADFPDLDSEEPKPVARRKKVRAASADASDRAAARRRRSAAAAAAAAEVAQELTIDETGEEPKRRRRRAGAAKPRAKAKSKKAASASSRERRAARGATSRNKPGMPQRAPRKPGRRATGRRSQTTASPDAS